MHRPLSHANNGDNRATSPDAAPGPSAGLRPSPYRVSFMTISVLLTPGRGRCTVGAGSCPRSLGSHPRWPRPVPQHGRLRGVRHESDAQPQKRQRLASDGNNHDNRATSRITAWATRPGAAVSGARCVGCVRFIASLVATTQTPHPIPPQSKATQVLPRANGPGLS